MSLTKKRKETETDKRQGAETDGHTKTSVPGPGGESGDLGGTLILLSSAFPSVL